MKRKRAKTVDAGKEGIREWVWWGIGDGISLVVYTL